MYLYCGLLGIMIACENLVYYCIVVMMSVSGMTSSSGLPLNNQSSEASASHSKPTVAHSFSSSLLNDSVTGVSAVCNLSTAGIPQPLSSCYVGPGIAVCSEKCTARTMMDMHHGHSSACGYRQMTVQTPIMMDHPNAPRYHPSTDFQATMSPSCRQMATFVPHRMSHSTAAVCMAGSSWGGSMQLPRQYRAMYGPPAHPVSSTTQHQAVDLLPTIPDAQEPVRASASTKSKRKSRSQSKESYSSIVDRSVPCPNIDVRQIIQEQRQRLQMETASCSAAAVHSLTSVWTMPTTAVCATSTPQHIAAVSSQTLPVTPMLLTAGINNGMTTAISQQPDAPEVTCTSDTITADVSVLSAQVSSADNSLHIATSVPSTNVSLALNTTATESSVSAVLHVTAPFAATGSTSCGTSWVYGGAQQYSQHKHWSQYSSHPLSCTLVTKSSVGMDPYHGQFNCSQGQQMPGILSCRNLNDMLSPTVTVTAGAVANSACLPGAAASASSSHCESRQDDSPIRLVQNMVSGLETTQNSLAIATSLIISQSDSVSRRRRSGTAESAEHIAANTTVAELCEEARFSSTSQNVEGDTNSSVQSPDDSFRCTQGQRHLPTTSAVTTVTSVLPQVLPAAGVVPSAFCSHPLPSASVQPSVSPVSPTGSQAHTVNVTSTSSTNDGDSVAVSGTPDADMDSACYEAHAASSADNGTSPQLIDSQVVDDDDSTQDCDIPTAGSDSGEVLCTTGTQTSTPASGMTNCSSIESGADGSESNDTGGPVVSAADDALAAESQPSVVSCNVPTPKPNAACEEKPHDDAHSVSTSTPVVLIPRVPQASFLLPQNIAFAPNPLVGHGFLQFQPPGEFGYGAAIQSTGASAVGHPGALGLVHFAAGPVVGPPVGNMMATSDAGGSFRLMTPVKSDSDVYSAAEFLPLMPAAMPAGHILLQNIVPTGLASTIVPFVQPAALCSIPGGSSALFAVSQASMMPVGAPLAFASVPVPEHHHEPHDHVPDQPDSTVDNGEMDTTDEPSSDDSADTEQVTSTDEPLDEVHDNATNSATKVASSIADTLLCSNSNNTQLSLTKTVHCSTLKCNSNTSTRMEYESLSSDELAGHSSTIQRSKSLLPCVKKRTRLSRSKLKMRHCYGYSTRPSAIADDIPCSSPHPSITVPASILVSSSAQGVRGVDALMSPVGSDELEHSLCSNHQVKDTAPSDSSVSTTLSLYDGSNDGIDPSMVDKCSHAGSLRKARWKKQALARRTRLRLRHSKHAVKPPAEARLSPTEGTHVGE